MLNKDSFKTLLTKLGFQDKNQIYIKRFVDFELKVDFHKGKLIYPKEIKINEEQTCNVSSNENFVVFECVHRLLEKKYKPEHIELEPKWKLGHGASGGRADIWLKDNNENSLLIIECKTAGKEFENAWKDTLEDGGQLFSYFQQEKSTQFLALYASDFSDDELKFDYKLISVLDNEEYLKSFGKKDVPCFKTSDTVKKIFKAWSETYQKDFATKGIFEQDIPAYFIGKTKYCFADLKEVDNESIQKKYHEFASILRQHNVSGHENAFDKLVNLFLAKIVDETTNKNELAFYWKGAAYDDIKSLIDRLQKYYKIGMEKFLKEDVTYIEKSQIDDAFKLFKNKPDATKAKIIEYFDQLKYYTNNDFAFIDVHNEKLFYQNSIVLLKIVQMLQDIRLQTETQNQFLGDLFEGFLDKGVKQSEGQFFTPMPIVKFLISSLPLEKLLLESKEIPKVIDYACGSGHFLNEFAHQITPFIHAPKKRSSYFEKIIGIEKEYRLSKVAKVSAFMYGQEDIEIVYADALAKNKSIKNGTYSVLVANPPYSVKGFLETLDDESLEQYELFESIDDKQKKTNNSIECFFVERAKQLLAPRGIAAIVLPSPILNNGNIYTKTREIIIKYFDIVAIAEFGSGTFGKTGTSTATLFLRRKDNNPNIAEHYKIRVEEWFNNDFEADIIFEDKLFLENYCKKIGVDLVDYSTLLESTPNDNLLNLETFIDYKKAFENSFEYKNIQKKKLSDKYKQSDKKDEIYNAFLDFIQNIEKDKLYFYMLAESNPTPVCLVKSPADNKSIKNFLGYEWSTRKGSEGIKYFNATDSDDEDSIIVNKGINSIKTPLFNPADLNDKDKINSIIRSIFNDGELIENEFVTYSKLSDMLDFSRVSFDKSLKTTHDKTIQISSKFPLVKLVDICGNENIKKGKSITQKKTKPGNYKVVAGGIDYAYKHNDFNREINTITISASGANAGYVNFWSERIFASDCTTVRGNSDTETKFLFYYLQFIQDKIFSLATGQAQPHVYPDDIKMLPVPKINASLQKQIVFECEDIEVNYKNAEESIGALRIKISDIFKNGANKAITSLKLSNKDFFKLNIGKRVLETELVKNGKYPVFSANVYEPFGTINKGLPIKDLDFSTDSVLWGIDGDWQVNCFPSGIPFYPTDHCGVLRILTTDIEPKYLAWALNEVGKTQRFSRTNRASIDRLQSLTLKFPSLLEQQKIVKEVLICENKIIENQLIMKSSSELEKNILNKYLN